MSEKETVDLSDDVARWAGLFGKPVALQLREPVIVMDAIQEEDDRQGEEWVTFPTTEGCGYPSPAPLRNEQLQMLKDQHGQPAPDARVWLFGRLRASEDGKMLVLITKTPKGALAQVTMPAGIVSYATVIVKVPEDFQLDPPRAESRLVRP